MQYLALKAKTIDAFLVVFKAALLCLSLCTRSVFSDEGLEAVCPQRETAFPWNDPNDVDKRIWKLASQDEYFTDDEDYRYRISICQQDSEEDRAVQQYGYLWHHTKPWTAVGKYKGAQVIGGTNWLMIKYFHGEKCGSNCAGKERTAVLIITCDPGEHRGSVKVIEGFESFWEGTGATNHFDCFYLFELNHDAACTEVKSKKSSPWFIALIILVVLETVYIVLGLIYQRYVVQAKGLEKCGKSKLG